MGFLPFVLVSVPGLGGLHLYMAINSWAEWPGYVKGIEFSVLDALALALYFSLPGTRHPLPFRFSMALYFLATLLSALEAEVPMAALFYSWQLARMFLVYAVVTRACADPRVPLALLKGLGAGLIIEASDTIWERFGLGILQTSGNVGHQNLLGLMSHFIVFPFFALLLTRPRGWLPPLVVTAGLVVEVLTTSRATVGLAAVGYAACFMLSILRQWTSRKALVLLIGVGTITVLAPLAVSSFEHRFAEEGSSIDQGDYDERAAYERAAAMMLSDHPLGVGANHFVVVGNVGGYYDAAGVGEYILGRSGNVHNVYWLVATEAGYPGLITLVLLLLCPISVAFRCGWRHRGDQRGDLLLGLGVALLIVYIHSIFEWILITFQAQYLLALDLGLVAGLAQQMGYWRRYSPQGARLGAGTLSIKATRNTP